MDIVCIVLGSALLLITLLDTFLAVLNYDAAGLFVNRIVRWQWTVMRLVTRRASPKLRPIALRQVTGVVILSTILLWISGMILGFALIYFGLIGFGVFELSKGVSADFMAALYLSVGQFSTVGADNIAPTGYWVLLPVIEALVSVVLLSFIITFLSNVYGVIQNLRSLCADFFNTGPAAGSATEALRPYFPDGEPRDLDRHLNDLVNDFNLYCDSIRQDHAAYFFQSGRDQFSVPFAMHMTSGTISALRWALPGDHSATKSPSLARLTESFNTFRDRRFALMRWGSPAASAPVGAAQFASEQAAYAAGQREGLDAWCTQFFALSETMGALSPLPTDPGSDDPYARYTQWLAFAQPAAELVAKLSRDLDYQPRESA